MTTTELKDLKKALQYKQRSTAIGKCYTDEMKDAVNRRFDRLERNEKHPETTVREFCKLLIWRRGQELVQALPDEGYSMGSMVTLYVNRYLSFQHDRTQEYAKSCKYRAQHGRVRLTLTFDEFKRAQIIGGVLTILPNTNRNIKKVEWFEGIGSKQYFEIKRVQGWLYEGYHAHTKELAIAGGNLNVERRKQKEASAKAYNKVLRRQYTVADSLSAGNCEAGTMAFILRCGLNSERKYRGAFLVKVASEKSSESVKYVNNMINYFANK